MIIKKKPSKTIVDNSLTSQLCSLILEAESKFDNGADKLNYVLNRYLSLNPAMADFKHLISDVVEYLLTLPTKKGGCGRE